MQNLEQSNKNLSPILTHYKRKQTYLTNSRNYIKGLAGNTTKNIIKQKKKQILQANTNSNKTINNYKNYKNNITLLKSTVTNFNETKKYNLDVVDYDKLEDLRNFHSQQFMHIKSIDNAQDILQTRNQKESQKIDPKTNNFVKILSQLKQQLKSQLVYKYQKYHQSHNKYNKSQMKQRINNCHNQKQINKTKYNNFHSNSNSNFNFNDRKSNSLNFKNHQQYQQIQKISKQRQSKQKIQNSKQNMLKQAQNIKKTIQINKKLKILHQWLQNEGSTIDLIKLDNQNPQVTRKASENLFILESGANNRYSKTKYGNIFKRKNYYNKAIHKQQQLTLNRLQKKIQQNKQSKSRVKTQNNYYQYQNKIYNQTSRQVFTTQNLYQQNADDIKQYNYFQKFNDTKFLPNNFKRKTISNSNTIQNNIKQKNQSYYKLKSQQIQIYQPKINSLKNTQYSALNLQNINTTNHYHQQQISSSKSQSKNQKQNHKEVKNFQTIKLEKQKHLSFLPNNNNKTKFTTQMENYNDCSPFNQKTYYDQLNNIKDQEDIAYYIKQRVKTQYQNKNENKQQKNNQTDTKDKSKNSVQSFFIMCTKKPKRKSHSIHHYLDKSHKSNYKSNKNNKNKRQNNIPINQQSQELIIKINQKYQ